MDGFSVTEQTTNSTHTGGKWGFPEPNPWILGTNRCQNNGVSLGLKTACSFEQPLSLQQKYKLDLEWWKSRLKAITRVFWTGGGGGGVQKASRQRCNASCLWAKYYFKGTRCFSFIAPSSHTPSQPKGPFISGGSGRGGEAFLSLAFRIIHSPLCIAFPLDTASLLATD